MILAQMAVGGFGEKRRTIRSTQPGNVKGRAAGTHPERLETGRNTREGGGMGRVLRACSDAIHPHRIRRLSLDCRVSRLAARASPVFHRSDRRPCYTGSVPSLRPRCFPGEASIYIAPGLAPGPRLPSPTIRTKLEFGSPSASWPDRLVRLTSHQTPCSAVPTNLSLNNPTNTSTLDLVIHLLTTASCATHAMHNYPDFSASLGPRPALVRPDRSLSVRCRTSFLTVRIALASIVLVAYDRRVFSS